MKTLDRLILGLLMFIVIGLISPVWAHSTFMSFYKVKQKKEHWSLTVGLATSSVEQTMKTVLSDKAYQHSTEAIKQQWLTDYLTDNTQIWLNDKLAALKIRQIKSGDHDIQVSFTLDVVSDKPKKPLKSMNFHITGFAESKNHHNIVLLDAPGFPKKVVLSHLNQFKKQVAGTLLNKSN